MPRPLNRRRRRLRDRVGGDLSARMSNTGMGKGGRALRRAVAHINPEQFARFAVVGAIATLVQLAVLVALVELAHIAKPIANALGYICGGAANYLLNRRFTFAGTSSAFAHGLLRFTVTSLIGLAINSLIFVTLMGAGFYYLIAWVVAVGLTLIWNYAAARLIVFR